jgi:8-oxo-dGTP diphosphatase
MSDTPIAVAVGLLVRDDRVLMGERRPGKVYPLHWEFPGGKIEYGETPLEALARELREELAIEIVDGELWFSETAHYSNGETYYIEYYVVRQWAGDVINHEFRSIRWISLETLPMLQHLSGNARILERLQREGIPA